jgi:hypothetical protein
MTLTGVVERFVSPLQDLVALGNAVACPLTDLRLYDAEYVRPGTSRQLDVEVLYDSHRVGLEVDNVLTRQEMLFRVEALGARLTRPLPPGLGRGRSFARCAGLSLALSTLVKTCSTTE